MSRLFCFGLGYCAAVLGGRLAAKGWDIAGTVTSKEKAGALESAGFRAFIFDGTTRNAEAARLLREASHVLLSIPPGANGDPALTHYRADLAANPSPAWIGYFSSVSVYGDARGGWVDETTPPAPCTDRGRRRLEAENAWTALGEETGKTVVIFRLPGIYGPGRSAIDQLRAGVARRVFKPGQLMNRAHVTDIANAVQAALKLNSGIRIFNVTDDLPAPPQDVIAFGAELLGVPCPPAVDLEDAGLTPMARSFYAESKRVSNARMKSDLGVKLTYPTYAEGLRAIARGKPAD